VLDEGPDGRRRASPADQPLASATPEDPDMFSSRFWSSPPSAPSRPSRRSWPASWSAGGVGLLDANWLAALSTAPMAAVVSVLTSVGSLKIGPEDSPSIIADAPVAAPTPPVPSASPTAPVTAIATPTPAAPVPLAVA
jgi:hypothetical protein